MINKNSRMSFNNVIEKIKNYLIENIVYAVVLSFFAIYMLIDNGLSHTLNYASVLLGLFVPIFLVINLYSLTKSIILNENIERKEFILVLVLIVLTTFIYVFGLHDKQRIFLGVINGISSIAIVIVMFVITIRR